MRRILLALVLVAAISVSGYAQTSRTVNLTTGAKIGPSVNGVVIPIDERGSGITQHIIIWNVFGTVSACSVKLEQSATGTGSWSDLIAGATCTSNGVSALTTGTANFIRVNATTLTGTGTLSVRYIAFPPGQALTATVDTTGLATGVAQGSTTSGELGTLVQCAVTTSAPAYTPAQTSPLSCDTSGGLRTSGGGSGGTQYTQDAALTIASTVGTMAMGRASAAAPSNVSADDDAVIPWYLRSGAQAVQLTNAGVLTLSGSGTATGALRVELPTNGTGVIATVGAVTAITNPLPAGSNVIGHVIVDTTSTTAVTQATAANLNATVVGTGTFATQAALAAETTKVIGTVRNKYADGTDMLNTDIAFVASSTAPVVTMNSASANGGVNSATAAVFDDTSPTSITENSFGFVRMSANRNLYGTIRDAAGNERGVNVNASNQLLTAPTLQAGSALAGEFVPVTTATTTDTALRCTLISAASTNSTSCKGSAGNVYGYRFVNTTATLYYLRMYNASAAPTCSSATGFIETIPIPAAATGAGVVAIEPMGEGYTTGIGFCFTGGSSSTDNTNAATGVFGTILYK